MAKSVYELAMFWSGRAGCFEAATINLLKNPSEENIKYWTARMQEWNREKVEFFGDVASKEESDDISVLTTNPVLG